MQQETNQQATHVVVEELNKLKDMLMKHDKYYDYSDDHSVWKKGNEEFNAIYALANQLKLAGYSTEVQELFAKYY